MSALSPIEYRHLEARYLRWARITFDANQISESQRWLSEAARCAVEAAREPERKAA